MSFVRVWIHVVCCTKDHSPVLSKSIRPAVFQHIMENAKAKGIHIDFINGFHDHVHVLLGLNADMSLSKTIQLLKGESASWINRSQLLNVHFSWAIEYFATSVSDSQIESVRNYIKSQEQHHAKFTYAQEYSKFLELLNEKGHSKAITALQH